jgi:hypothetical protein
MKLYPEPVGLVHGPLAHAGMGWAVGPDSPIKATPNSS